MKSAWREGGLYLTMQGGVFMVKKVALGATTGI